MRMGYVYAYLRLMRAECRAVIYENVYALIWGSK